MRIRGLICIAVGLMLTAAAARAEEVTIVSSVLGPEGPLFVDGNLYDFVAWTSGTLSKWDGKEHHRSELAAGLQPQWPCAHQAKDIPARVHRRAWRDPRTRHQGQAVAPLGRR